MPDDPTKVGATTADVLIEGIRAIRDIFNDWRVILLIAVVVLLVLNKMTGSLVFEGLQGLVRAWRCQP